MTKKATIVLAFITLAFTPSNAQNVGIGTATPTTKTQIVQTADVTALEIDHAGATGNTIIAFPQDPTNISSAVWILNETDGRGINLDMTTPASTATGIELDNDGLGAGIFVLNNNAANTFAGLQVNHSGTGFGALLNMTNTGAAGTGLSINQDGTDAFSRGFEITMDAANIAIGAAVFHAGTGMGSYIGLTNLTSTAMGQAISIDGLGRGIQVALDNTANTNIGASIFHAGTGVGLYSTTQGQAVVGESTGTDGQGGTFQVTNTAANSNSIGLFVIYDGNGAGGTGGGGNAVEIQHNGAIGNGADLFMGSPAVAPGPANTTSEYNALSVSHYATGTSPTPGLSKSAASFSNNSADPTVTISNNGNEDGDGLNVFNTPLTGAPLATIYNQPSGIYSQAGGAGVGIGVFGYGGDVGVLGYSSGGSGMAVYGFGNTGASGAKMFHIDHPLDPENKTLSHYSVESNEILNMYRGVVQLDASGTAVINLPDYFDIGNINPSYQLTAIGTPTQPYVATEIASNQFTVAGAPNTKVSWTVYAERNDPTIQYYSEKYNLKDNSRAKRDFEVGKYITPQAYGKDETQNTYYSPSRAKNYEERVITAKLQKSMSTDGKSNQPVAKEVDVKVSPKKAEPDINSSDVIEDKQK
jgi:hypothetical protein